MEFLGKNVSVLWVEFLMLAYDTYNGWQDRVAQDRVAQDRVT